MEKCFDCPRKCGVDRNLIAGFCGEQRMRVSHIMLHHWEEPLISGEENSAGSGTIFFTGCNLKCVYCQNSTISRNGEGQLVSPENLVEIMKDLESRGALNINFVTPTHFTDEIILALKIYKPSIPIVWNTSGYESLEKIEMLKGFVDVFLTDIKYSDENLSKKYSAAKDYFEIASKAVLKMREVVGEDIIKNGLIKRGIIIRHMVLPGCSADSIKILDWVHTNLGTKTIISVMNQYTPYADVKKFPELNRKVSSLEYKRVIARAKSLGFETIFVQDSSSASEEFIPNFKNKNDTKF